MRVLSRFQVVVDKKRRYVSRRGHPRVSPECLEREAQVANRRGCESGIVPPDVARISTDFVHDDPIFVKKALAMAFGVGSTRAIMTFDPGSAMTATALGFLIATDFLTAIGFNVLNASVASLNSPAVLDEAPGLDGAPASRPVDYPYSPRGVLIDANRLTLVLLRRNRRAFCVYCLLLCRRPIPSMVRLILRKGRLRDRQT